MKLLLMIKKWIKRLFGQTNQEKPNFAVPPDFAKRPTPPSRENMVSEEEIQKIYNIIRDNVVESIDFMLFNPKFNFHEDPNLFRLHVNMLYLDYVIDEIDPKFLIDIYNIVERDLIEHINQKNCEEEMSKCTWN